MRDGERQFPFDGEFQKSLLRMIFEDRAFCDVVTQHLEPKHFESEALAWVLQYGCWYRQRYDFFPTLRIIRQAISDLPAEKQALQGAVVEQIEQASLADSDWMKDRVLDFLKRQQFIRMFHQTKNLFNSGREEEAYDMVMREMEALHKTAWRPFSEEWHFDNLPYRQEVRMTYDPYQECIGTGLPELDHVLDGGLSVGELGVWVADAKGGKALRDDQLVLTPSGWTPIAALKVGDEVIGGSTGKPVDVRGVWPQGKKPLFEVMFSDGGRVIASGDHVWAVQTRTTVQRNAWFNSTTDELARLREDNRAVWIPPTPYVSGHGDGGLGYLDPYLFGLLLGDGGLTDNTVKFHKPERDLWLEIAERLPEGDVVKEHPCGTYVSIVRPGTRSRSVTADELDRLGLLGLRSPKKFIPDAVFTASRSVRFGVLSGLCDTDGSVTHTGCAIEFSSSSEQLADGVLRITRSLGGYASKRLKVVNGVTYFLVRLRLLDGTFPARSEKNVGKSRVRKTMKNRRVLSVTRVADGPCTCITVGDPGGLFITNDYIVTHNSTMLVNLGVSAAVLQFKRVAHFVLEGTKERISDRYDANMFDEMYSHVRTAQIDGKKFVDMRAYYEQLKGKLVIQDFAEDDWTFNVLSMTSSLKRWKQQRGWEPDLIILDYADLLNGRAEHYKSETDKQKSAYRDLVSLVNRGNRIWTASQAQRPSKGDEDKPVELKPHQIADCYEKVRVAHFIGSINFTREEKAQHRARLLAAMYRGGEAGAVIPVYCNFAKMQIRSLTQLSADKAAEMDEPSPTSAPPAAINLDAFNFNV